MLGNSVQDRQLCLDIAGTHKLNYFLYLPGKTVYPLAPARPRVLAKDLTFNEKFGAYCIIKLQWSTDMDFLFLLMAIS